MKWVIFITIVPLLILITQQSNAQLAAGKSKFLGSGEEPPVPASFSTYWNQVTPGNHGKWDACEPTRDVMNWSKLDEMYNYAKSRGFKFKQHTFVWGSQYPSWITSLSQADQRAEVEEWIQAYASRYASNTWAIDVVNEPIHAPPPYRDALGGSGSTGWDWVIWAFQKARQYLPNAKLHINEYGTENDASKRSIMKTIINLLKSRGLIDGIGIQAHCFNLDYMSASQLKTCLDDYATLGLPIHDTYF